MEYRIEARVQVLDDIVEDRSAVVEGENIELAKADFEQHLDVILGPHTTLEYTKIEPFQPTIQVVDID